MSKRQIYTVEFELDYRDRLPLLDIGDKVKEVFGTERECDLKITMLAVRPKEEE